MTSIPDIRKRACQLLKIWEDFVRVSGGTFPHSQEHLAAIQTNITELVLRPYQLCLFYGIEWPTDITAACKELRGRVPVLLEVPESILDSYLDEMKKAVVMIAGGNIDAVPEDANEANLPNPPPVWTDLQLTILDQLSENALTREALAKAVRKPPGTVRDALRELVKHNAVANKRGLGYYRPDLPPKPTT